MIHDSASTPDPILDSVTLDKVQKPTAVKTTYAWMNYDLMGVFLSLTMSLDVPTESARTTLRLPFTFHPVTRVSYFYRFFQLINDLFS